MIPNLKEGYGTFRHSVVIPAMKSPYSLQRGIFYTFSSLIKPSTLPPSLHSWPVILFHGENVSNPERTASSSPPPHLCTVQTLVWLLWLSLSAVAVPASRRGPSLHVCDALSYYLFKWTLCSLFPLFFWDTSYLYVALPNEINRSYRIPSVFKILFLSLLLPLSFLILGHNMQYVGS